MRTFLAAKYLLQAQTYVNCFVSIESRSEEETLLLLGVKTPGDTQLPIGTQVFLRQDPSVLGLKKMYFTVLGLTQKAGRLLHVTTPLCQEVLTDRRQHPRLQTRFQIQSGEQHYKSLNGSLGGLLLLYRTQSTLLGLTVGQTGTYLLTHKGKDYPYPGRIVHIQYDWKGHQHLFGVGFDKLDDEQQTILNLVIDPDFKIDLSKKETIDASQGKIRKD
jgi:hypothetical protein